MNIKEEEDVNIFFSILQDMKLDVNDNAVHDGNAIIKWIKENNIGLVIFDSFTRFYSPGFDENSASDMTQLFNNLKKIRKRCPELTLVTIDHFRKGGQGDDLRDMIRASSDKINSCDSVIGIKRKNKQEFVIMEHIKNRSGEEMKERKIAVVSDKEKNSVLIFDLGEVSDVGFKNKVEIYADDITKELTSDPVKFKLFEKGDLLCSKFDDEHTEATFKKALKKLEDDGILVMIKAGKYTKYSFHPEVIGHQWEEESDYNIT